MVETDNRLSSETRVMLGAFESEYPPQNQNEITPLLLRTLLSEFTNADMNVPINKWYGMELVDISSSK